MKRYHSATFDTITNALYHCEDNQVWHVINIYPTGYNHQVRVVYYINT